MSPTAGLCGSVVGFLEDAGDGLGRRIEGSDCLEGVTMNCRARAWVGPSEAENRDSLTMCFRAALLNRTRLWTLDL